VAPQRICQAAASALELAPKVNARDAPLARASLHGPGYGLDGAPLASAASALHHDGSA